MIRALVRVALVVVNVAPASGRAQTRDHPLTARSINPPLRTELLAARDSIWYAWFYNDRTRLNALLPQDAIAINNGDTTWQDRTAVLASAEQFAHAGAKLIRVGFPRTEFQVYEDVAILYSTFELEMEQSGKRMTQRGRATEIFVRRNGRWQNAGWHLDSGR